MKKILHISKYYYPFIGGVEQVARDCVNAVKGRYEQKIICFNHENGYKKDFVDEIETVRVGCFAKISSQSVSTSYGKHLKKIMIDFRPDIIIFHYPNPFAAHYLKKYLKNQNIKLILWWHLDITKQKILGKFFEKQNYTLLKRADKIVATSPNYIEGSPWLLPNKEKCTVIPCCVNEERLKLTDGHTQKAQAIKQQYKGKTICFAFGRHVEYKGLTYLIKAAKFLNDSYVILIGGEGPLTNALKDEAKDDLKIRFLGKMSDDDLKANLLACDIFCFPSITKNEAFGIALVEAMYYGKPAITFTIPGSGVNYVNINGKTGLEVENGNYKAYAEAIESLSRHEDMYKSLSDNAMARANELFLNSRFNESLIKLIAEVE